MKNVNSAGGIVINNEGKILVVSQGGLSWSLPKGYIDEGEDALTTAKREIYEESGIKNLEFVKDLGSYKRYKMDANLKDDKSELKNIHMFLFRTNEEKLKPIDSHNPEARWIEKDKVAGLLSHRKDKAFFLEVIEKI